MVLKNVLIAVVAIVFILGMAVLVNALYKNRQDGKTTPSFSNPNRDAVLIVKGDPPKTYAADIPTGDLTVYREPGDEVSKYKGLPAETETKTTRTSITRTLFSDNRDKVIVVFSTFDTTEPPSEFDGSLPVLKTEEYLCQVSDKSCISSAALTEAESAEPNIWWQRWDAKKNLLWGHAAGEGVGNASPVVVFDTVSKTTRKTTGYDYLKNETRAEVPSGTFSPSLRQFVMIQEDEGPKWILLLYSTDDLSKPIKRFDVTTMRGNASFDRIMSVAWSPDEQSIAVGTDQKIHLLELTTGEISLKFNDPSRTGSGLFWDFNDIAITPSGRWIVFVDFETEGDKTIYTLKAIDQQKNDTVTEVARDSSHLRMRSER